MYTLLMRLVWFPWSKAPSHSPSPPRSPEWVVGAPHDITIGAATTVTLYVVQINDPIDESSRGSTSSRSANVLGSTGRRVGRTR